MIPKGRWDEAHDRHANQQHTLTGGAHGPRPKYLLSGLLRCGECAASYVVTMKRPTHQVYGCAGHKERGASVCDNGRTVRRERIERMALEYVFEDLFTTERIAYLNAAVHETYARAAAHPDELIRERERALAEARAELAHIANAIRQGIITPTTRTLLLDAEGRVAALESALVAAKRKPAPIEPLDVSVRRYLRDLRDTVNVNPEKARRLLSRGLERIVLQREDGRLVGYFHGTLAGVLRVGEHAMGGTPADQAGAGRGI